MPRNPDKPRVPVIWDSYSWCGVPLKDTRIICFKTPITTRKLSPHVMVQHMNINHYPLGLVLDLTDTMKYYDPSEFVSNNIIHYKIRCCGMTLPSEAIVAHFNSIVTDYLKGHKRDNKLVGVHCFTGVNRTGYLVCRYLIDVLKWDPITAIHAFQDARGEVIEHEMIREDLLGRVGMGSGGEGGKDKCVVS